MFFFFFYFCKDCDGSPSSSRDSGFYIKKLWPRFLHYYIHINRVLSQSLNTLAQLALFSLQKEEIEFQSKTEGLVKDVYAKWKESSDVGLLDDCKMPQT